MRNIIINNKVGFFLACITGLVFVLSACSSDDVAQAIADEFVTIEGQIVTAANQGGEEGVAVKGFYQNSSIPGPSATTNASGMYSIDVLKNTPVSLQLSKSGFTTFNSAYLSFSANETGMDTDLPTTGDADLAIDMVFPGLTLGGGQAWLALDVSDANGAEIDGAIITTNSSPLNLIDEAATDCDGMDSNGVTTIANCIPARDGPMYLAYFSADTEVTVAVTGFTDQQIAPVRVGEVTFIEFEQ